MEALFFLLLAIDRCVVEHAVGSHVHHRGDYTQEEEATGSSALNETKCIIAGK